MDTAVVQAEVGYGVTVLLRAEEADAALAWAQLGTRVFPDAYRAWDGLGRVHRTLGQNEEAIQAYERSLELNPENATARRMIDRIRGG
jgi:tetratricopeptide (TPR) repeat protein